MGVAGALTATLAALQWITLSVALILYNKWLMQYGGFPLPLTLCALHMASSFALASVFRLFGYVEADLSMEQILKLVVPTGLLFAAAICTGNEAFLFLTVSFIQMVKAWTPTIVLVVSVCAGLETLSCRLVVIVLITSSGVALAIYGELEFQLFGFLMILSSLLLESLRLVLVEILYSSSAVRLSGLSGVYYMSPVCFVAVLPVAFYFEKAQLVDVWRAGAVSPYALGLNCACAFALNVSSLVLVKHTSALSMKVVGVFKDWVVIIVSSVVFNSVVQPMQWVGYSVAFVGIALYVRYKYAQHVEKSGSVPVGSESDSEEGSSIGLMSDEDDDLELGDEDGDDPSSTDPGAPGADEPPKPAVATASVPAPPTPSLMVTLPAASQAPGARGNAARAPLSISPIMRSPPQVPSRAPNSAVHAARPLPLPPPP